VPVEMEIRDATLRIALESRANGYRRITAELNRHGHKGLLLPHL
jgi:hypothetical protein